jgi:hypothetical protein
MTSIFSPEALDKIVRETLPDQMDGSTHAVVVTTDQEGATAVASFKRTEATGFNWELQAAAHHDWSGDNSVGARVILKW